MKSIYSVIFILLLIGISALNAQDKKKDSTRVVTDDVVVTGSRYEKKIIDVPFSVFRVESKELKYGKKVSARDVLADVPGLFLQSRYGNHDVRLSIRGFGSRSNSGIRGVRVLQDGIPVTETDGENLIDEIDFTSLGGVEVAKGNLSSLYSNATGGVINFLTDYGLTGSSISAVSQIGNFGLKQQVVKGALKADTYRLFFSYGYRNLNGFRKHSEDYSNLINILFKSSLSPRSTLDIHANFLNGVLKLPGSLTSAQFFADPYQARGIATAQDMRRETGKGRIAVSYKHFLDDAANKELEITFFGGLKDAIRTDEERYTLSTRYSAGNYVRYTSRGEIGGYKNEFTTGFDAGYQNGPVSEYKNIGGFRDLSLQNQFQSSASTYGVYVQDMFAVNTRFSLYLATRYDKTVYAKNALQFNGMSDAEMVFNAITPKLGFNYKLQKNIALYGSFSSGIDIPALSELENFTRVGSLLNKDLSAAKTVNGEIGIKGTILGSEDDEIFKRLFFEATLFHYIINDDIVPYTLLTETFFRTAKGTKRTGLELGLQFKLFDDMELTVNYVFADFKYTDYQATVATPSGNINENYNGKYLPAIPRHTFNFIFNTDVEISEHFQGLLQFDCDYITKMYATDDNSVSSSDYFFGSPMAGIVYRDERFEATFYTGVGNVFDRRYSGYLTINDAYGRFYNMGEPRNPYAGLNIKAGI